MSKLIIYIGLLCIFCYPFNSLAATKNVTITWTMPDTTNVAGYRMYYAYDSMMSNKTLACETMDKTATSLTCPDVDLQSSPVYFVIAAVTDGGELSSSPAERTFGISISPVQDFRIIGTTDQDISALVLSDITPSFPTATLAVGDTFYSDRTYTITSLPAELENATAILTANDDKYNTSDSFLTFTINRNATLSIAYDSGASPFPAWLTDNYTRTAMIVGTTNYGLEYVIWQRSVPAGTVSIPGNNNGYPGSVTSNYFVFVQ